MANYTGIQGQNILIVDTDPANPTEGQIWYNTTSNLLKGYANVVTNAWASGGNLGTARYQLGWSRNSNSRFRFWWSNIYFFIKATESYNGTSWSAVNYAKC
jgi:hypothetical protein